MGAWGPNALESDEGLDVVDFIGEYISTRYPNDETVCLNLSELIAAMKEDGFFGQTFDEIEFFYDHSAMALTELYLIFKATGQLPYEDEENESTNLKRRINGFNGDQRSFTFLLQYLTDIRTGVPDKDGEREILTLWQTSANYSAWQNNLDRLIAGLEAEISSEPA